MIEISLDVCAPILAPAPNDRREDGTLYTVKDPSQSTAREIILRIACDHRSNVRNEMMVAAGVRIVRMLFLHTVFGDFLIRLEVSANGFLQFLRSFVNVFGFGRDEATS